MDGEKREEKLKGYSDIINSNNIISFSFEHPTFKVECNKIGDELIVRAFGGNTIDRDETAFRIEYSTNDKTLLDTIQRIIKKYKVSYNNGYILDVIGMPYGYGDTINVIYDNNEKIYKHSNQVHTISDKAIKEIYDAFLEDAKKNNLDFNYKKSNVPIYDDATEEFLQGRWIGNHNKDKILVIISGINIKIFINDKLTDDTNYIIIRGCLRKRVKTVEVPSSEYDFEPFRGLSSIRKKNDLTIQAYFEDNTIAELIKE